MLLGWEAKTQGREKGGEAAHGGDCRGKGQKNHAWAVSWGKNSLNGSRGVTSSLHTWGCSEVLLSRKNWAELGSGR